MDKVKKQEIIKTYARNERRNAHMNKVILIGRLAADPESRKEKSAEGYSYSKTTGKLLSAFR